MLAPEGKSRAVSANDSTNLFWRPRDTRGEATRSPVIRGHDLAAGDGPQRPPDRQRDRVPDEADRPVPEEQVDPAAVAARRGDDGLAGEIVVREVAARLIGAG